jgi:hypothetical protein
MKNTANTAHAIATNVQQNMRNGEEARTAAKEALEVGEANLQMARQIKNAGPQTCRPKRAMRLNAKLLL